MFVGRITKEIEDVSRFTVDLTEWLDDGETATNILSHSITLGTTGWSNTPFPVPGSNPPNDPTPLLFSLVQLVDGGTGVEVYVSYGTPGNVYTCQFEIIGTTLREVNFEVGVQISGQPPAAVPIVTQPIPADALSIMGGTMLGPLYLYEDPAYPTEAATKQYVDYAVSLTGVQNKVSRAGDIMTGFLQLSADPVQPLQAATKNYVDQQTGSTLPDAPNDAFYYGRHGFAWARVIEEAPINDQCFMRVNGGFIRGVPMISSTLDVRVTETTIGGGPLISGWQVPPSPATDFFAIGARHNADGTAGDGGFIQLFGPSAALPLTSGIALTTGTRPSLQKSWSFQRDGSLSTPGAVFAVGVLRSETGRVGSRTTDGTFPSVFVWDSQHSVASGFWINSSGAIGMGATDGTGLPSATWLTITSTGISTTSLTTSANVAVGTSLSVGTSFSVGTSISGASAAFTGTVSANSLVANTIASATSIAANGTVSGAFVFSSGGVQATNDVTAGINITAGGQIAAGTSLITNSTMAIGPGGAGRIMQMAASWYWDWNSTTGTLNWMNPSGSFASFRQEDQVFFAQKGPCCGIGVYQNLSDIRIKQGVRSASYGLSEVLQLEPILFQYIQHPERDELGFSAQQLRAVIPEAVRPLGFVLPDGTGGLDDPEPTLSMGIDGVVVATVNAIKELEARIRALEAR